MRLRRHGGILVGLLANVFASGCTLEIVDTFLGVADTRADGDETGAGSDVTTDDSEEGGDEGQTGGSGSPEAPLFDVGDGGEIQITSCEFASEFPSHLGCEFFGIDVDGPGLFDLEPFGFVAINPLSDPVTVWLERHDGLGWVVVDEAVIAGADEHVFLPSNDQAFATGVHPGRSLRITSNQPIVLIQAHPAAGAANSASATMLQPSSAWATNTAIAGWRTHLGVGEEAFLGVVARTTGTTVVIHPICDIDGAPASWADAWVDVDDDGVDELVLPIEPGQLIRLDAVAIDDAEIDHGISGSTVGSGAEHLTSAFSAHTCAAIPDFEGSCGHMQEQMSAALIGQRFVAPRLITTASLVHERTMIQVVATEPETEIVFSYHLGGETFELETVTIDPDEPYGLLESDHDLAVTSNKPIIATTYMTNALLTELGSPSMVQLAPVEQWTGHHWVWVPDGFETHLIVTAAASVEVEVGGLSGLAGGPTPQPDPNPIEAGLVSADDGEAAATWSVRRFAVGPGVHQVQASGPASVIVAGWRAGDGFAYLGGWGPSFADLGPAG